MTTTVSMGVRPAPVSPPTEEADLVARLKTGDEAAYEELFRTHAGGMWAVARRFFGDADDAADAVQEAFVSAFRGMGAFVGTARLGTWLHRVTVNACLMRLRARKRRPTLRLDNVQEVPARCDEPTLGRSELCDQVRAAIERLPEGYRTVIRLRDLDGLDTAATAAYLGINVAVVKTRLHRARIALKALLEPEQATLMS
jgi:RNA polymerase sigma-70 factor (ECF subfamily)